MRINKLQFSTFLAILFHVSGLIGILFTPYKDWFIQNTPLNLCLMALLLFWNQPEKNLSFFGFCATAFLTGMGTEMIGVNTGKLFGVYQYGDILGAKLNGVPFLIGINWVLVILASATVMVQLHQWVERKMNSEGKVLHPLLAKYAFIIDGAILATLFDWIMEPVAMKLGFWQWMHNEIPLYNYLCWLIISAILIRVYKSFYFERENHFAVHLLLIQSLFFFALRTFL